MQLNMRSWSLLWIEINTKWLFYYLVELVLNQYATGVVCLAYQSVILDNILLNIPPLKEQENCSEIEILEAQIAQAQQIIDDAPQQKQAILQKYL